MAIRTGTDPVAGDKGMNVHLIVIFGRDAAQSPMAVAMRDLGVTLTTFSDAIRLNYPQPIFRYLLGWPHLLWFSFATAFRSLRSQPAADAVVVNSHFDVLAYAVLGPLLRRARPRLVLPGFIYTQSARPAVGRIKHAYYRWVLSRTAVVICHSHLEVANNQRRFAGLSTRFVYFPYAIHVSGASGYTDRTLDAKTIVSAGRSGRDYALLLAAMRGLDATLYIISDQFPERLRAELPDNVRVLDDCYDDCYFEQLADCRFVVVPLSVQDISAGQMVLLQAMAMGKPTVISRTATTVDYVQDGDGVILVEPGDLAALRAAVHRLAIDDDLCATLGRRAAGLFEERYSIKAYAAHLVAAARLACAAPMPGTSSGTQP